ncbi:UPF0481 protein At3g47200-like isoform X2 [Rosa chinensis]|uniref:UPF0481 protein At3g47200-like isoform X2 n=1 Tax=Rosa chinensis TaxID=74649 RepID=UPI001AD8B845|nr:UPF0481 protein At3g47200-like isoform X2 [Rosa chinensis]
MARNEDMASMNEAPSRSITSLEQSSKEKLFKNIEEAEARLCQFQSSKPKIQRVPDMLRDHPNLEKYYEPRAVALGPFHHDKARCQLAEKFKLALAAKFIQDSGRPAKDLHKIVEDNIKTLKDCYDEEATMSYTNEALTHLLFLDGCSTLQFIYSFMNNELANFKIKRDQVAFAEQDLFLLENQLPYQVLKLLMSLSDKEMELKTAIDGFVGRNIMAAGKKWKWHKHKKTSQPADIVVNMEEPTHLLELLRTKMLGPKESIDPKKKKPKDRRQSFRNIQELKATGIHLKPNDVKQLRSARVLHNLLGSDEEVAQLFNEIGTDLVPNSETYRSVKSKLEKHYKTKWKNWMAQFCHDHFSSPWTILAFLGVLAALGLSSIQTWYTINSPPSACDAVCEYLKKRLKIE